MKQKIRTKKIRRQLNGGTTVTADPNNDLYTKFGEVISAVATIKRFTVTMPGKAFGTTTYERVDSLTISAGHEISNPNNLQGNYLYFDGIDDEITVQTVTGQGNTAIEINLTSKKIEQQKVEESKAKKQNSGKFIKDEKKTEQEVPVYFSERPIKNIGEFIKYAKANKGPSKSLLALAREKDKGAAAAAAIVSGIGLAGQASVTLLASTGVGLPLAGAIAGLLLITNKLANMYIHKLKMKAVLYDVITIVSSCFIIYDLIDRVIEITTIVLNSESLEPLTLEQIKQLKNSSSTTSTNGSENAGSTTSNNSSENAGGLTLQKLGNEYAGVIQQALNEMYNNATKALNIKKKDTERLEQIKKIKETKESQRSKTTSTAGDAEYKKLLTAAHEKKKKRLLPFIQANAVDQIPLEDRVSLNIDIQKRLYEKMQGLTEMLLKNAREKDLDLLASDPQMQRSGFGAIVEKEIKSRTVDSVDTGSRITSSLKAAYNTANRVYSRNFDSDTIRKDVMAELSLVLGYFFLLKNQYDLILDTYKDTIPEWPEIYAIIRETEEFKLLVVPPDALEYSKKVIEDNKAEMETAAVKQKEVGTNDVNDVIEGGALKTKKHNKKTKWHTRKNK